MRRALVAFVVAAGLAVGPAASADHESADCGFVSFDNLTPGVYRGVADGHAVAPGETVAVRCILFVNGVEAATTPNSAATPTVATVVAEVTFTADDDDSVWICAVATTTRHGERMNCSGPPWEPELVRHVEDLYGAVVGAVWNVVEPPVCATLRGLHPGTSPVVVTADGDVWVAGELVWDCPPYEWT